MTTDLHALITRLEILAKRTPRTMAIDKDEILLLIHALKTALAAQDALQPTPEAENAEKGHL